MAASAICIDYSTSCNRYFALDKWWLCLPFCRISSGEQPSTAGDVITVTECWQSFGGIWRLTCLFGHTDQTSNELFVNFLDLVFHRHCMCLRLFCKRPRCTLLITVLFKLSLIIIKIISVNENFIFCLWNWYCIASIYIT